MNEAMNPELGKVYSDPYSTSFIKENEESTDDDFTSEQREVFLEAVKQYKKFGESVYRKKGLAEVCKSIKGLVEVANRVTIKETGDWFDGVTVSRHLKRMNESYKVFEKTLTEVDTLQQRMESSYDEIGEVLGKYYEIHNGDDSEIEEGNEFGAARAKAIAAGNDSFEVDGKEYPLKGVDKDDKENAEEFANEANTKRNSMKLKSLLNNSIKENFSSADIETIKKIVTTRKKLMGLTSYLKKAGFKNAEFIMVDHVPPHIRIKKGSKTFIIVNKKYADKPSFVVGDIAGGLDEWTNWDESASVVNEGKDVGHYERIGNQTIVDSNFVNYSKGVLPNSELVHLGMGNFSIKSQSGNIKFERSGKLVGIGQDFVGRPHRMTDDKNGKLVDLFLKLMLKKKKAVLSMSESVVNEANAKSKDSKGMRMAEAIYNNVDAIYTAIEHEKEDVDRVVGSFGPVLINAIKATLKHKFKPTAGNEDKLKDFYKELKNLLNVAESLVKRPSKAGVRKLDAAHRQWWNHRSGADVVLNGKYADNIVEYNVNEAVKYDIGMGRKGNGITIYNKAEEEAGDFKNIAHIDNKGNVKFFDKKLPSKIKKMIEAEAQKMKESVTEGTKMIKLKNLLKESMGLGELPSSKLIKMKMTLAELEASEKSEPSMKLTSMVSSMGELPSSKLMKMKMTLAELEASEKVESPINEGFATWEMSFTAMTIGGVELDPKNKYKVKARSTVEAIKKASKEAGLKGDDWMVTQTNSLKKLG